MGMIITHLTSSTFFGGPERQMLGLAHRLVPAYRSVFLSFAEKGRCRDFISEVRRQGFDGWELSHDSPRFWAAFREIQGWLQETRAGALCCHGYKANLLGRKAAQRLNIPAIGVSRGWTGENLKVRFYESVDRYFLRRMDRVVCVSASQAVKVRQAGVAAEKMTIIRNAIDAGRFARPDQAYRSKLEGFFTARNGTRSVPTTIVGAAGRLSPEKGFSVLIEAARLIVRSQNDGTVGFILFGDGPLRRDLRRQIDAAGLGESFVLPGFRDDLDGFLPFFDILVVPSFTEGLPNVILEALASGVPVIGTDVGGTPELLENETNGLLVSPGDSRALARCLANLLSSTTRRLAMSEQGRQRVLRHFTFEAQASAYRRLFAELRRNRGQGSSPKSFGAESYRESANLAGAKGEPTASSSESAREDQE
jgi:glycosyltransferase involved in cell wall biosynthesis